MYIITSAMRMFMPKLKNVSVLIQQFPAYWVYYVNTKVYRIARIAEVYN